MIRVIIADDSSILRNGLKAIVEQDDEIEVVGCAENGKAALELCDKLSPNLVLMDIRMPICDGVEATKLVKSKYSSIKVIILTTFDDEEYISAALNNGANGYVLKDISDKDLMRTIKSTANGLSIIHQNVFNSIINQNALNKKTNNPEITSLIVKLTDREKDIIRLIVDGKDNKDIAAELYIVEGTARNMVSAILDKLQVKDRTQLAVFAIKNNIV